MRVPIVRACRHAMRTLHEPLVAAGMSNPRHKSIKHPVYLASGYQRRRLWCARGRGTTCSRRQRCHWARADDRKDRFVFGRSVHKIISSKGP